jgi:retinol dehydrogenase-12
MAGRSEGKMKLAINELEQVTGKLGIFLKVDLIDLNSVKSAAEEFLR